MSVKWINLGQWPCYLGFTRSEKAFNKEMKRLKVKGVSFLASGSANATTHSFANENHLCVIITMTNKRGTKEQEAALIAHEALHAVQYIRDEYNRGQCLGVESEAYLLQYIVQECLQEMWHTNRTKRVKPTA